MDCRRRSFLAAAGSVVSGVLAGCSGVLESDDDRNATNRTGVRTDGASIDVPTAVESSYPQYQYDAANTGTVPDVSGPIGAVTPLFEFGRSGFSPGHRMGSPSLCDGRLYLTEGHIDAAGDDRTTVYAVDALTGTGQWATLYRGTNAAGQTAVTDDVVLASVGDSLVGLDPATGVERWSFDRGLEAGVTVADGTAYTVGRDGDGACLYALSAATGSLSWEASVDASGTPVTPAVTDGLVYTGGDSLQAFETAGGAERWRVDDSVSAPVTVAGERVVVGSGTTVRVRDRADGAELWSDEVETYGNRPSPAIASPPAVTEDTIFAVADGGLSAFSLAGSQRRYALEIGIDGTPVVADGYLYLFGRGQLSCRSAADGATEWSYGTQQRASPSGVAPVVADNVVYFPAEKLYAIAG